METRPCQIIEFFNGTKQLLVPLFQRPYEWKEEHWQTLWDDLLDRYELKGGESSHFTGAIVTGPAKSIPIGVSKHLVIDGQQRLTTVAILICAVRSFLEPETPKYRKLTKYLVNEDDEGADYYKLLPTELDREPFFSLVKGTADKASRITAAFAFFRKCIAGTDSDGNPIDLDRLTASLHTQLTVISIHLSEADDPYLIFESLNAKGAPLTQADLIRNYLLLRLHTQSQQQAYDNFWIPMQRLLPPEHLTEFMRQQLMLSGEEVARSEIYAVLKRRMNGLEASVILDELTQMHRNAGFYAIIVGLTASSDLEIDRQLARLRRLDVSVATPLILKFFVALHRKNLSLEEFYKILNLVESYVVRRMVCRVPTNQLKRIFLSLIKDVPTTDHFQYLMDSLRIGTSGRRWPKEDEFSASWLVYRAYATPLDRCKLILETLERDRGHKEPADFDGATIEHVMPQTLSEDWRRDLGVEAEQIHEKYLDTFGNLTLSAYNSSLYNYSFDKKKVLLKESHFELNKEIGNAPFWDESAIVSRATTLFERAKRIWARPE